MAVRKLLVASQKGGVGKTTTSINLAAAAAQAGARVLLLDADPLSSISAALNLSQHPRRKVLRDAGMDLPGVLVSGVIPGLDVVSPYEEGCCTDEDLAGLLRVLAAPELEERYGCLLVGAPPFMGANAAQLLGTCDEFMIVMRAEAMAYRTLPAFLELVQRNKDSKHPINLRGIVLTIPEQDAQAERWERELRGRFGGRILPTVIPYDEEIRKALEFGRILLQAAPEAPATQQYKQLTEVLALAKQTSGSVARGEAPLLEVAASMQAAGLLTRNRVAVAAAVAEADTIDQTELLKETAPLQRSEPEILLYPPPAPSKPKVPLPISPAFVAKTKPTAVETKPETPVPATKPTKKSGPEPASAQPQLAWIGVAGAAIVGVGLRFFPAMPDFMMPLVVGTLVAAGVILLLKLLLVNTENNSDGPAEEGQRRNNHVTKPPSRLDVRKDSHARMAALARKSRERYKRGRDSN
jgi:chromosome partitioning protein